MYTNKYVILSLLNISKNIYNLQTLKTESYSGLVNFNGGITGTTANFNNIVGITGSYSGLVNFNGGITGTTANFSNIVGATGSYSSLVNFNGGITGTTASFSGLTIDNEKIVFNKLPTITAGITGENVNDNSIATTKFVNEKINDIKSRTVNIDSAVFTNMVTFNSGITGTTANFSNIVGTTGSYSGLVNFNGGLTGTTATFSEPITANGGTLTGGLTGTTASFFGDITAGSITTISGNISSTDGNIQTIDGNVEGKNGTFQQLYVSGVKDVSLPELRGIYLGLDNNSWGGIDICSDVYQYIDFTTRTNNYRGRIIYNNTNNDFKMHVDGSSSAALTLNNSTLSTNNITGSVGSFNYIVCRGTSQKPIVPTAPGAILGCENNGDYCGLELCGNKSCYIDFTTPNVDYTGRNIFVHSSSSSSFNWYIGINTGALLKLTTTSLNGPTYSATSDKRLKFNEKLLTNALDVINKLEPLEYDQTQNIVDQFNENTPHTHQCGFIAQSIQKIDQLKHAVTGGEIGEDGKETIRALNYNAVFTYAVKSIQELHAIVKQQQEQIDAQKQQIDAQQEQINTQKQQIDRLINIILNA